MGMKVESSFLLLDWSFLLSFLGAEGREQVKGREKSIKKGEKYQGMKGEQRRKECVWTGKSEREREERMSRRGRKNLGERDERVRKKREGEEERYFGVEKSWKEEIERRREKKDSRSLFLGKMANHLEGGGMRKNLTRGLRRIQIHDHSSLLLSPSLSLLLFSYLCVQLFTHSLSNTRIYLYSKCESNTVHSLHSNGGERKEGRREEWTEE